jgi:type II secretory pathway pseudopilin PulG
MRRAVMRRSAGVTYLWVLLMIAVVGAGAAAAAQVWVIHAQREREAELLFVGEEIRRAIGAYFESTPGGARQYPRSLENLLRDRRYPVVRRYLRRVYRDPMIGAPDWVIVRAPDGGIAGVHSRSREPTLKKSGFRPEHAAFENAATHADWKFIYATGSAGTPGRGAEQGAPRSIGIPDR